MTTQQLRSHPGYKDAMAKIIKYRPGFQFTIDYTNIPRAKANGLRAILRDACKLGYLESISFDVALNCEITAETYRRTEAQA